MLGSEDSDEDSPSRRKRGRELSVPRATCHENEPWSSK